MKGLRAYPAEFLDIPACYDPAQQPPDAEELDKALATRKRFLFPKDHLPYMVDMVRVLRLLKNASVYIEIGTYDKGNLAYASELLAANAHIIDVEINDHPDRRELLKKHIKTSQRLTSIIGDSTAQATVEKVQQALGGQLADGIFIDGNHIAEVVIADYAYYSPIVKPGGFIFFHDVYWNGDDKYYGVARAMAEIDRLAPVYVVLMQHPVHRFLPWLSKGDTIWGGVGMIQR